MSAEETLTLKERIISELIEIRRQQQQPVALTSNAAMDKDSLDMENPPAAKAKKKTLASFFKENTQKTSTASTTFDPKAPDSLPESLRGQPIVLLHGLTELLPGPSFCLHNHPGRSPLGLPVPVSCLRSPTSQPGLIGLLLQLDGILYFQCPPPGSGIAASTGTGDLTATAPSSRFDNGGAEHGPLRLNISSLPRDLVVALPEVRVEDLSDRRFGQTFPANPYSTLGSAKSVQPPPPPSDPTHH
ncbi:uncharacterized protein LOC120493058 [Pimephales promelas]|uniref:uncharacterized protein LOC120493058 n=1 Tax=Pimephales promelas TaxID=90988 RepID=UPI0019555943|nr:uncharacterized protein LOC120493058 [Pimephales promelas]